MSSARVSDRAPRSGSRAHGERRGRCTRPRPCRDGATPPPSQSGAPRVRRRTRRSRRQRAAGAGCEATNGHRAPPAGGPQGTCGSARRRPPPSRAPRSLATACPGRRWRGPSRAPRTTSGPARARLLTEPEREGGTGSIDHAVDEAGRDDLAAQRVRPDPFEERSAHSRRERAHQLGNEVGVVGKVRSEQLLFERDLRVRHEHGELGRGEAETGVVAIGQLLVARGAVRPPGRDGRRSRARA